MNKLASSGNPEAAPRVEEGPQCGSNPEFARFADLARRLFAVPKSEVPVNAPKLKVDGTPKQKPGRKAKAAG